MSFMYGSANRAAGNRARRDGDDRGSPSLKTIELSTSLDMDGAQSIGGDTSVNQPKDGVVKFFSQTIFVYPMSQGTVHLKILRFQDQSVRIGQVAPGQPAENGG